METKYKYYNHLESFDRIASIIAESDNSFEELQSIPSKDKLTFQNGFYVNCTALFIDIRDSSTLPSTHNRPKLAKLYRAYLSEAVAIVNSIENCKEISIVGDCVSGIIDTPLKRDIDEVFDKTAVLNSMMKYLNYHLSKSGIVNVKAGIGVSYGRALMVKAGYKGSTINDVVWMGDVVNQACKLGNKANNGYVSKPIYLSNSIYENLSDENKKFCSKDYIEDCYVADIINLAMNEHLNSK